MRYFNDLTSEYWFLRVDLAWKVSEHTSSSVKKQKNMESVKCKKKQKRKHTESVKCKKKPEKYGKCQV